MLEAGNGNNLDTLVFDVRRNNGAVNVAIDLGLFKCNEFLNHSEAEEFADYLQYIAAVIKQCAEFVKDDNAEEVNHDNTKQKENDYV